MGYNEPVEPVTRQYWDDDATVIIADAVENNTLSNVYVTLLEIQVMNTVHPSSVLRFIYTGRITGVGFVFLKLTKNDTEDISVEHTFNVTTNFSDLVTFNSPGMPGGATALEKGDTIQIKGRSSDGIVLCRQDDFEMRASYADFREN